MEDRLSSRRRRSEFDDGEDGDDRGGNSSRRRSGSENSIRSDVTLRPAPPPALDLRPTADSRPSRPENLRSVSDETHSVSSYRAPRHILTIHHRPNPSPRRAASTGPTIGQIVAGEFSLGPLTPLRPRSNSRSGRRPRRVSVGEGEGSSGGGGGNTSIGGGGGDSSTTRGRSNSGLGITGIGITGTTSGTGGGGSSSDASESDRGDLTRGNRTWAAIRNFRRILRERDTTIAERMAMFPSFLSDFQQTPGNNNNNNNPNTTNNNNATAAATNAATARQISSPHPQNTSSNERGGPQGQGPGSGPTATSTSSSSSQNGVVGTATTPISPASGGNMFSNAALPLSSLGSGAGMNPSVGGGGAGNAGLNAMPMAPGHQMDLNYIWQLVQELSAVLAENRESTEGIVRKVGELQRRALRETAERRGAPANMTAGEVLEALHGVIPGAHQVDSINSFSATTAPGGRTTTTTSDATAAAAAATIADLQAQNETLRERNAFLQNECMELDSLVTDHVNAIETILGLVRNFSQSNTQTIINIHRTYHEQLDAERQTNMDLRNEHFEWQARLMNLAGLLREAYRESTNDEALTEVALIAGLRSEVRALRRHIGLPVDDSDEEGGGSAGGGVGGGTGGGGGDVSENQIANQPAGGGGGAGEGGDGTNAAGAG
ncbi:MAG: hypothetical protein M1823_001237 [Watsoniomyces obsoletus]|nr:MAG: hypothetical protein M1823_001237 [Watsoniomyces obsoletus]